ncbi:MAG: 2Fe-2S iron-sulfur cluster-binding protein [Deferrisomatales bacterium]|nr:2Fe-2S iron-sulfur cluster-binding protein [Deferrisomatales bacterium]
MRSPTAGRQGPAEGGEGRVALRLDGAALTVPAGYSLLQAADAAGAYVPRLCAHPALGTRGRCGICAVEVDGAGVVRACEVGAEEGMEVWTASGAVRRSRVEALHRVLAHHPHACLVCSLADDCSRTRCARGLPEAERCCWKRGTCELAGVAAFVGIGPEAPMYVPRDLPVGPEGSRGRDPARCIECLRCEDACRGIAGVEAAGGLGEAGVPPGEEECALCRARALVCPTGARSAGREERCRRWLAEVRERLALPRVPEAPRGVLPLSAVAVARLPEAGGVYQLWDGAGGVRKIRGVSRLRQALEEELAGARAAFFTYEEAALYTRREAELLLQHLAEHGRMPGSEDPQDVF